MAYISNLIIFSVLKIFKETYLFIFVSFFVQSSNRFRLYLQKALIDKIAETEW